MLTLFGLFAVTAMLALGKNGQALSVNSLHAERNDRPPART